MSDCHDPVCEILSTQSVRELKAMQATIDDLYARNAELEEDFDDLMKNDEQNDATVERLQTALEKIANGCKSDNGSVKMGAKKARRIAAAALAAERPFFGGGLLFSQKKQS